jgi:hypothetical protein
MELVAWGLTTLVTAFVGSYLAAYLKKKGENLATHEDIDKLVTQVAAVTITTKQIEERVSDEFWQKQKRWEAKRDAIFEVMRRLGECEAATSELAAIYCKIGNSDLNIEIRQLFQGRVQKALDSHYEAMRQYGIAKNMATLTCGYPVGSKLGLMQIASADILTRARSGETVDPDVIFQKGAEALHQIYVCLATELGIPFTLQSSDFSAAQAPAPLSQSLNEPREN